MSVHRGYSRVAKFPKKGSRVLAPDGRVGTVSRVLRGANRGYCDVDFDTYPHSVTVPEKELKSGTCWHRQGDGTFCDRPADHEHVS